MKELTHQIVTRIPTELNEKLAQRARAAGRRRSEIVRVALEAYLRGPEEPVRDRVDHLLGSLAGGPPDLSTNRKRLIRAIRDRR
jgi:metal-responsive CopG/Arc/MetJ family transcriptional regulator